MINVAICDDDSFFIEKICDIVKENVVSCNINTYLSGEELLKDTVKYDIYILDIDMSGLNGMEVGLEIRKSDEKAIIIFLTNFDKYVFDAYEINAFRYIQKSRLKEKMPAALKKAVECVEKSREFVLINNANVGVEIVSLNSIIYFEKVKKYVEIYLKDGRILKERTTLINVMKRINKTQFVLIKKGIVINLDCVKRYNENMVVLYNDIVCYISRNYLKSFINSIRINLGE